MKKTERFLTPNIYSRPMTTLKKVKKVVIHGISELGTPNEIRDYYNNLATTHTTFASVHYIVGVDGEVVQCVPENEVAFASKSANKYAVSIECCQDNLGGFTEATLNALTELCADICKRHKLKTADIVRYYDVTKKVSPKCWSPNGPNKNAEQDFCNFKTEVNKMLKA